MRAFLQAQVDIAAPARAVWDYVTDWPRQAEWVPMTHVQEDGGDHVGGRINAFTGLGRVGFHDPMTITAWEVAEDGSGRCEVLHTGTLVRGEAEFSVTARTEDRSTFTWWEHLDVPAGPVGGVGWRLAAPVAQRILDRALRRMATQVEALHGAG